MNKITEHEEYIKELNKLTPNLKMVLKSIISGIALSILLVILLLLLKQNV